MKPYGGVGVYIHIFLTSATVGGGRSASCLGRFIPREKIPEYSFYRSLGGPQNQSRPLGEKETWPCLV
jgi:hypothetical protein